MVHATARLWCSRLHFRPRCGKPWTRRDPLDPSASPWWQQFAPRAELILFVSPKIRFVSADGTVGRSPAQGSCLMAVGARGREALHRACANGLGTTMTPAGPAPGSTAVRLPLYSIADHRTRRTKQRQPEKLHPDLLNPIERTPNGTLFDRCLTSRPSGH